MADFLSTWMQIEWYGLKICLSSMSSIPNSPCIKIEKAKGFMMGVVFTLGKSVQQRNDKKDIMA